MKKINIVFLFLITSFLLGCNNDDNNSSLSQCLKETIEVLVYQEEPQTPKTSVEKYIYQGETVYLLKGFIADTFDPMIVKSNWVIDENCIVICHVEGTIEAQECIDWESAQFIETVWTDPR